MTQITFGSLTLADGSSLAVSFVSREGVGLTQETPETLRLRASRVTYFGTRAIQRFTISFSVKHAPAASIDAAKAERHAVLASFADTQVADLIIANDSADPITYADAKLVSAVFDEQNSSGLSNAFLYTFEGAEPDTGNASGLITWDGELIAWGADA